jgi:NADH dehydrogenase FAD-containing subunit
LEVENPWAAPEVLVNPAALAKVTASAKEAEMVNPNVNYVYGTAAQVAKQKLILGDQTEVPFDILIAATGFLLPGILPPLGISAEDRAAEVTAKADAIKKAKNVAVAGGGHVGIECAGYLAGATAGQVTLYAAGSALVADEPSVYGQSYQAELEKLGVQIKFNTRVVSHEGSTLKVQDVNGTAAEASADVFIPAFAKSSTTWLKEGDFAGALTEGGQVRVNAYLQSDEYPNLFAIGATNNVLEASIMPHIGKQAKAIALNVAHVVKKEPLTSEVVAGSRHPWYAKVGPKFGAWRPDVIAEEDLMMASCLKCCGCPFNICCPCFCCAATCGPFSPMCCGYCCGAPEGEGVGDTCHALAAFAMGKEYGVKQ